MSGALLFGSAQSGWFTPRQSCVQCAVEVICPLLPDAELQEILSVFEQPQVLVALLVALLAGLPLVPRLQIQQNSPPGLSDADKALCTKAAERHGDSSQIHMMLEGHLPWRSLRRATGGERSPNRYVEGIFSIPMPDHDLFVYVLYRGDSSDQCRGYGFKRRYCDRLNGS
jgi:hypothetical protein